MSPSWMSGDPGQLVASLGRVAARCSVEIACGPYLAAMAALSRSETSVQRFVSNEALLQWITMFNKVLEMVLLALAAEAGADIDAETRTMEGLLFCLEVATRGEVDALVQAVDIAAGRLQLDTALRSLELDRLTRSIAVAKQQLSDAQPVKLDLAVLAAIDAASYLHAGDIAIPLPPDASTTSSLDSGGQRVTLTFSARATITTVCALYSRIRRIDASTHAVTTCLGRRNQSGLVTGDLPGGLGQPGPLCVLPDGDIVVVDRGYNLVIRARLDHAHEVVA